VSKARKKKQPSLSVLERLPELREALAHIGLELVVRPSGQTQPVFVGASVRACPAEQEAAAPVVQLDTPERREYLAELAAKRNPPKPLEQLPAAQRRAIEKGYMGVIQGEREAKLASMPDGSKEVAKEEFNSLGRVSDAPGEWGDIKPGPLETAEMEA
jgi:hypothetical protein